MELINFDKIYNNYVSNWAKQNATKLKDSDPVDFVNEIYEEWRNKPLKETCGISATEYFGRLNPQQATLMLKGYDSAKMAIPSPLIDRISNKECEDELVNIITEKGSSEELVILAANTLEEIESKKHIIILTDIMLNSDYDNQLRIFASEILSNHLKEVKDKLILKISGKNDENDMFIADVLVYNKGEEKIFNLLKDLFLSGKNNPLYAAYLGMYDDDRALPLLENRLDSEELGYIEFLEIRNSIERLGGEVTIKKDFSHDPDYIALKGIK